jgi:hypothetical protein
MIAHDSSDPDEQWAANVFPQLIGNGRKTSDKTIQYNCLAWALGIDWGWFDEAKGMAGYYWPPGIPREWSVGAIRRIFVRHGYTEETTDSSLEPGIDKVAFYSDESGELTHFARQLTDGKWTSKLGLQIDIEHTNLECLQGDDYGAVTLILKRRKPK